MNRWADTADHRAMELLTLLSTTPQPRELLLRDLSKFSDLAWQDSQLTAAILALRQQGVPVIAKGKRVWLPREALADAVARACKWLDAQAVASN